MPKIPYEIVALEANKILNKILSSQEEDMIEAYYDRYIQYLEAAGWTAEEFDKESMKRIDKNWEPTDPKILN